jgi:hypothetical protein
MSLAVLADHMASKGRGGDSMLIHMSPREVQGLQALAMAHGGSLTINPDTGLPEALSLGKLLPAILGFAVTAATGLPAWQVGLGIGAVETARTGDLGRGISAGLGAYGGAGLSAGLTEAGASTIGAEEAAKGLAMNPDVANQIMNAGAGESAAAANNALQQQVVDKMAAATPYEKLSTGFDAAKANPMGFAKSMSNPLMLAAGPAILAGANVQAKGPQTVTKPGMIRPYAFDPYGGTYTAGTPYEAAPAKAAEGGLMGMAGGGYSPGMFDFAQKSEPVVRMASGGIASYAPGGYVPTDTEIFNYFKTPGLTDAQIAADMQKFDVSPERIAQVTGTMDKLPEYNTRFVQAIAKPDVDTSEFMAATKDVGLQNQALANALQGSGLSAASQYALTHQDIGPTANVAETGGGLEGLSSNINYIAGGLQNQIGAGTLTGQQAREQALTEMNKYGLNAADIMRATGKTLAELFPDTKVVDKKVVDKVVLPDPFTSVVPGGTQMPGAVVYDNGAFANYGRDTGNPLTSTPGDIITNPDGTRTIVPNIPGRPYGGFSGMEEVRNAYTAGGGRLGYVPYTPKTIEEFNAKYNRLTGGSKQSYDYLMGKTPYSPVPYTPTGEIQKPYWESVGRFPVNKTTKKYIYDGSKYVLNPDYVKPPYVLAGEKAAAAKETAASNAASGKSINVIDAQGNTEQAYMRDDGFYYTSSGAKFDEKGAQVAAGGGLMAMAAGGSASYNLGDYSDGGRLLRGPGDGVSDSIPASIGNKRPARLADGEFVVPARIVSELGNGSTEAGARKLYAMMDRVQAARRGTVGKGKVAKNSRADKHLPV